MLVYNEQDDFALTVANHEQYSRWTVQLWHTIGGAVLQAAAQRGWVHPLQPLPPTRVPFHESLP